jgi:hypothetical protein
MLQNWYADEMGKKLHKDKKFEEIDMRLSVVKTLHASNPCFKYNDFMLLIVDLYIFPQPQFTSY